MKRYLPAKRAMLCAYLLLALLGAVLSFIIYRYAVLFPAGTLRLAAGVMWLLILVSALLFIPHYFFHAKVVITNNEIAASGGFFYYKDDYLPIGSVKSVSVIATPLGFFTGFNFVVINALGSRVVLGFLRLSDAKEIADSVNRMISGEIRLSEKLHSDGGQKQQMEDGGNA